MGLAEKKALNDLQTTLWPKYLERIQKAAGFSVEVAPQWESLMPHEKNAPRYPEFFEKAFVMPLEKALSELTADEFSKKAVQGGLKKISITNTKNNAYSTHWANWDGGTVTLEHDVYTNLNDVDDRADALKKAIENAL